jgi:hypothetical protein
MVGGRTAAGAVVGALRPGGCGLPVEPDSQPLVDLADLPAGDAP